MVHQSFSYISLLITHIHVHYHPPTTFIMGRDPWVNLDASTWSPSNHLFVLLVFQVLFIDSKLHTLYYYLHMHFTVSMISGYHRVAVKWKQIFPRKEKNVYSHIYSVIALSSVQSSAFKREDERKVKSLYGQSLSDSSEPSERYSGTGCTENFHR